jgi:hypothetical protein
MSAVIYVPNAAAVPAAAANLVLCGNARNELNKSKPAATARTLSAAVNSLSEASCCFLDKSLVDLFYFVGEIGLEATAIPFSFW